MRKWLISICALVMAGVGVFILMLAAEKGDGESTQPTQTTTVATEPNVTTQTVGTTVATEPAYIPIDPPDMSHSTARQIFVYDALAERMLYTLGDQKQTVAPASLTKLFTAYVALQYLEPGDMVTVGEEAGWIEEGSSIAAVSEGCRLSVGMILQGMLMQSGNDAAYAIAVAAGRAVLEDDAATPQEAYNAFVLEMNRQLKSLGMVNTHFTNPDGYHDDDHYSTAEDLLQMAKLALADPLIMEYCGLASAVVHYDSGEEYTWKNSNFLLHESSDFYCPEATGLKTGTTSQAGNCLIASFNTGDTILIIGVLGCEDKEDRFEDAIALFEHYR